MVPMHKSLLVLALLVGCGDDGIHHLPDAPPGPDAATPDAPQSGVVTLTITQGGDPRVDVDVYFLAADSALVAKIKTNAQGVASATMGLGGSVTAIDPFALKSAGRDLRTFVGVKPGDSLKLHTGGTAAQGRVVNFTLTLPTDAFASTYYVYSDCGFAQFNSGGGSGSGGGPVSGPAAFFGCGTTSDFLIETYDFNGLPVGALYKAGVALTEGATVDLTAEPYTTPIPTRTVNWANVPAAYTSMTARNAIASAKGFLTDIDVNSAIVTAGAATATFTMPTVTAGISIMASQPGPSNFIGRHTVLDWAPQGTTPIAIDLAGALLATYTTAPSVSAATHTITWAASAGATPDFAWATLSANRLVGQSTTFWSWDIVVPFATTTVTLPTLPTEIADLNFMATDTVNLNELITAKVPGGYDAVRAEILSSSPKDFVAGPSGRIAFENMDSIPTNARIAPPVRSWTTRSAHPRK